jgi:hypothetical protein
VYCEQMDANLLNLGIPFDDIKGGTAKDFLYIRHLLRSWRMWIEMLMPLAAHLLSIEGSKRLSKITEESVRAGIRLTRLTVLGCIFLPLSFTAALHGRRLLPRPTAILGFLCRLYAHSHCRCLHGFLLSICGQELATQAPRLSLYKYLISFLIRVYGIDYYSDGFIRHLWHQSSFYHTWVTQRES